MSGIESLIEGYEKSDFSKKLKGGLLLDTWAQWKGAKGGPSDHGIVGVMEWWSNGLELKEGFYKEGSPHQHCFPLTVHGEYPLGWFPMLQSSNTPWPRPI